MALRLNEVPGAFRARTVLFDVRELIVIVIWEDCGDSVCLPLVAWFWSLYEGLLPVTLHQSFDLFIEIVIASLWLGPRVALLGASDWASRSLPASVASALTRTSHASVHATKLNVMPICGHRLALVRSLFGFTWISRTVRRFYFDRTIHSFLYNLHRSLFIYWCSYLMASWLCRSLSKRVIESPQLVANRAFQVDARFERTLAQAAPFLLLDQTSGHDIIFFLTALACQLFWGLRPRCRAALPMTALAQRVLPLPFSKRCLMMYITKAGLILRLYIDRTIVILLLWILAIKKCFHIFI